jgi:hypothetical protein
MIFGGRGGGCGDVGGWWLVVGNNKVLFGCCWVLGLGEGEGKQTGSAAVGYPYMISFYVLSKESPRERVYDK